MQRLFLLAALLIIFPTFSSAATCPNLTRTLAFDFIGTDVTELQQFLIERGDLAWGNANGYFNSVTETAVKRFQCREMQICSGTQESTGYGRVGPQTRAKIAAVCTAGTTSSPANTVPVTTFDNIPTSYGNIPTSEPGLGLYVWQSEEWSSCVSGTQTRVVQCVNASGSAVGSLLCSGTRPASSQTCTSTNAGATLANRTIYRSAWTNIEAAKMYTFNHNLGVIPDIIQIQGKDKVTGKICVISPQAAYGDSQAYDKSTPAYHAAMQSTEVNESTIKVLISSGPYLCSYVDGYHVLFKDVQLRVIAI